MQKAKQLFESAKISVRVTKPSLVLTNSSCGYGLSLNERNGKVAAGLLRQHGIRYGKIFFIQGNAYREVLYGLPG